MFNYLKIFLGILIVLSASRFIPHPPNFTSLIALSFYVPAFMGIRYTPAIIGSFLITDLFLGFHNLQVFTWGSVLIIGYLSKYFLENLKLRLFGVFVGSLIFFVLTNFGVFLMGGYGYTIEGLFTCYYLAIPFYTKTIVSTFIFSILIESIYSLFNFNKKLNYFKQK